jgi:hypothetical protein
MDKMVSVTTKLHILLLMLAIGITLYMYVLYKEVRTFEKEILDIKKQITNLSVLAPIPNVQDVVKTDVVTQQPSTQPSVAVGEALVYDNGDDVSVTSNEIKDILTNIQEDDDEDDVEDPKKTKTIVSEVSLQEQILPAKDTKEVKDLLQLSDEELSSVKYDDIRSFLRKKGISGKGSKQEYIDIIIKMRQESPSIN